MDKYEYKLKTEQMLELMESGAYNKAAEIADTIDWKRVRNATMLTNVSDIYERNGDNQKSYDVLNIAYHSCRRAAGRLSIVYALWHLKREMWMKPLTIMMILCRLRRRIPTSIF